MCLPKCCFVTFSSAPSVVIIIFVLTDATIYVGGLDEKVNESLVWELFVQAGPVVNVHMPKDRVTLMHQVSSLTHFLQKYYIF